MSMEKRGVVDEKSPQQDQDKTAGAKPAKPKPEDVPDDVLGRLSEAARK